MDIKRIEEINSYIERFIKTLLEKKYDLQEVYLFGSYVRGANREDSDIDLAIVLNQIDDIIQEQMNLMKIACRIDARLEIHPFEESEFNSENPFANEILKNGIRIV